MRRDTLTFFQWSAKFQTFHFRQMSFGDSNYFVNWYDLLLTGQEKLIEGMALKLDKVLCSMFLFAF